MLQTHHLFLFWLMLTLTESQTQILIEYIETPTYDCALY